MSRKRRGLRIGTKLLLFSLVLFALPWLGYVYVDEMRNFLLGGQEKAQALTAQAVATVLHDREDLFPSPESYTESLQPQDILYAFPLNQPIQLDGYKADWEALLPHARHHGPLADAEQPADTDAPLAFSLMLGSRAGYLYAF